MKLLGLMAFCLFAAVIGTHVWLRSLAQIPPQPDTVARVQFTPATLPTTLTSPLRLVGAWTMTSAEPRLQGLSGLASDGTRLLAVSDMGFAVRFTPPGPAEDGQAHFTDLRDGPGAFGRKINRDAEAVMRDAAGKGWWVAYEQYHSLWHYDDRFVRADRQVALSGTGWSYNKGAEGIARLDGMLAAVGEYGNDVIIPGHPVSQRVLVSDWMVADAANAPDGSVWLLLRHNYGVEAAIAPLVSEGNQLRIGTPWPIPKGLFDNFEGMTITDRPGGWRFWLVTDDGHRFMARTLLIALDLDRAQENARR